MNFPIEYTYGNNKVTVLNDGTKIIEESFLDVPGVRFPETIDLKVTNYCNGGCIFCHENSDMQGKHANLGELIEVLDAFPFGVELAVGGGNPLIWPHLTEFLTWARDKYIVNLTISGLHVKKYLKVLEEYQAKAMLCGIGVSAVTPGFHQSNFNFPLENKLTNVVGHIIPARWDKYYMKTELSSLAKIRCEYLPDIYNNQYLNHYLILGFKWHGRSLEYKEHRKESITANIEYLRNRIPRLIQYMMARKIWLSFDNLALSQYNIHDLVKPHMWQQFYLGTDGTRSFYMDAVEQTSAINSTSLDRKSWQEIHPLNYFHSLQV